MFFNQKKRLINFIFLIGNLMHSSCIISKNAIIHDNVSIGPHTIIHDNVEIFENTIIGAFCEIGVATPLANDKKLIIGKNSLIRSHSIFYIGSKFGDHLKTGHNVCVRENISAEDHVQIGTSSELQGDTIIGNNSRFQSNVFIPKQTIIKDFVWLMPNVVLTNDPTPPSDYEKGPTIHSFSVVAANATILPEVIIEENCLIAAGSVLTTNTEKDSFYVGVPAKRVGHISEIFLKDKKTSAYPWTSHFKRGYPDEILKNWVADKN
ncbi:MAG: DapH/DapD/GlmU-related protein [Pseudomonadota bacterium]